MPWPLFRARRDSLTMLACAVAAGCTVEASDRPAPPPRPSQSAAAAPQAAVAEPAPPAEQTNSSGIELAGDLRPAQAADLSFKIGGQLASVKVGRGERVKKGALLAALSDAEARAQLAQADGALAQTKAQLLLAQDAEARAQDLVAKSAAPGSQATVVRLQAEVARAGVAQAQAARDLAAAALMNHQLRAPFDGEVVKVPDGVGQIVGPGATLFRLEALDQLVLKTTVSELELARIRVGDEVSIEGGGRKIKGKVRVVVRSLEAQSRRAPVEIDVDNHDRALVAGSYVRARLSAR